MSQKTTVVNLYDAPRCDIFVGRGSHWGNPFRVGRDGDHAGVVAKYRCWVVDQPELMENLPAIKGKVLGCYCKPRPCHGDVLAELADGL